MTFREIVMSSLQGKKPRFLQIGFVVVFLLCMGTQTLFAQEIQDTVKQKENVHIEEQMPEFPGGDEARVKFIQENLQYPKEAREKGLEGRAMVGFVVEADGSVFIAEIRESSGHPILDEEAVRVIKSMPKWKPGYQRGKAIRVYMAMPITFKLNEETPIETNKKSKKR